MPQSYTTYVAHGGRVAHSVIYNAICLQRLFPTASALHFKVVEKENGREEKRLKIKGKKTAPSTYSSKRAKKGYGNNSNYIYIEKHGFREVVVG